MEDEIPDRVVIGDDLAGWAAALAARPDRLVSVPGDDALSTGDGADCPCLLETGDPRVQALLAGLPSPPPFATPREGIGPVLVVRRRGLAPLAEPVGVPLARARRDRAGRPETLGTFADRAFRPAYARAWLHPLARAIYGPRAAALGAADALPDVVAAHARGGVRAANALLVHPLEDPAVRLVQGGEAALGSALRAAVPRVDVVIDVSARSLSAAPEAEPGCPRVHFADDSVLVARRVVLALGPRDAARLLDDLDPLAAQELRAIETAPTLWVTLRLGPPDARRLPPVRGLLFATDARARANVAVVRSNLDAAATAPDEAVVDLHYGGDPDRPAVDLASPIWKEAAIADLSRAIGRPVRPREATVRRGADLHPPVPGRRARLAAIAARLGDRGVALAGRAVSGPRVRDRLAPALYLARGVPSGLEVA